MLELARRKSRGIPDGDAAAAGEVDQLVSRPELRDALQSFARERKWIDEMHLQACRIPAPTFLEEKRAEWMAHQFQNLGWDAKIDRAGNVIALATADAGQPLVAVTAHLDTVLAPRTPEEILIERDGRFRGPGISDNGAGLAALLALAKVAKALAVPDGAGLALVANVGEEGEGNLSGMKHLCNKSPLASRIRSFLVIDGPNTDHITTEALACRRFEVTLQGPGGHSWSDFGVPNPVHALSRIVAAFAENRTDPTPGQLRSSFNFGILEGGSSVNAIPSVARTKLDLRSESPAMLETMVQELNDIVSRVTTGENERASTGRLTFRVRESGSRPGGRLNPTSPLLKMVRAVDGHLGLKSHLECASTDANIPLSMGLQAISIGAGGSGGGAHTPSEWYSPEARDLGLRRVLLTVWLMLEYVAAHPA